MIGKKTHTHTITEKSTTTATTKKNNEKEQRSQHAFKRTAVPRVFCFLSINGPFAAKLLQVLCTQSPHLQHKTRHKMKMWGPLLLNPYARTGPYPTIFEQLSVHSTKKKYTRARPAKGNAAHLQLEPAAGLLLPDAHPRF